MSRMTRPRSPHGDDGRDSRHRWNRAVPDRVSCRQRKSRPDDHLVARTAGLDSITAGTLVPMTNGRHVMTRS